MSSGRWRAAFGILAVLVVCAFLTPARAGVIRGAWDPVFNSTFNTTGFLGEVVFFVPNDCLANDTANTTAYFSNSNACSSNGMYLISAEVSLYNYPDTTSIITTITYAPPVPVPDPILGILVEYSDAGVASVIGLDTDPLGPRFHETSAAPDPLYLLFASGDVDNSPHELAGGAYLLPQICDDIKDVCYADFSPDARSNPGPVAYTPEPGSLSLLLGAFAAGWLVRRRTAAAS